MTKTENNKTNFLPFFLVGLGLMILIGIAVYFQAANGHWPNNGGSHLYSRQSKSTNLHQS